jgi:hypothetical protein
VNVEVYENGSARWTFTYFTPALNESEKSEFQAFADRFEFEETDLWSNFQGRADRLTSAGTEATGRNMTASGFEREASLGEMGNRGEVTMSFMWSGFAQVEDSRVVVADVFDGVFYLGPDQWLILQAGPGLTLVEEEVAPDPDERSAESDSVPWFGDSQFTDNRPRVVFTTDDQPGSDGPTTTGAGGDGDGDSDDELSMALVGLVVLVVGLGAGAAWRSGMFGSTATDDADDGGGATTTSSAAETTDDDGAVGGGSTAAGTGPAVTDEELLTDEDRVLTLLEDNGGRMKQANIVDETGWSKSKVSMLLSEMEDDDEISKLRVGRENIISLRGHEPDAAGSPFEDED